MGDEFVADSEGEGGLELSPLKYGHPIALDAPLDRFQVQQGLTGAASYSPSTISEFPSTLQATAKQPFDSPIVEFTATTHSSKDTAAINKAKPKPKLKPRPEPSTVDIVDLSDDEDYFVQRKPRKPPRKKEASVPGSVYAEPSGKNSDLHKDATPTSGNPVMSFNQIDLDAEELSPPKDKEKKRKNQSTREEEEDAISDKECREIAKIKKATKKRKSTAKKAVDDEESVSEVPKEPSKKRKSPDTDTPQAEKPSKKRKRTVPQAEDAGEGIENRSVMKVQKGRRGVIADDESEDELLLTADTLQEPKKFISSAPKSARKSESIPPEDDAAAVSADTSHATSPQNHKSRSESPAPLPEPSTSMPAPRPPPAKVTPRLSINARPTHGIPKRGSISDLLRKTGLYAPLSSSKLTRKAGDRIAPLHATRTTPPPPPPPIPKPKKKVVDVDEDEEDFTGMTERQIAKYLEEKKKKAWYSP